MKNNVLFKALIDSKISFSKNHKLVADKITDSIKTYNLEGYKELTDLKGELFMSRIRKKSKQIAFTLTMRTPINGVKPNFSFPVANINQEACLKESDSFEKEVYTKPLNNDYRLSVTFTNFVFKALADNSLEYTEKDFQEELDEFAFADFFAKDPQNSHLYQSFYNYEFKRRLRYLELARKSLAEEFKASTSQTLETIHAQSKEKPSNSKKAIIARAEEKNRKNLANLEVSREEGSGAVLFIAHNLLQYPLLQALIKHTSEAFTYRFLDILCYCILNNTMVISAEAYKKYLKNYVTLTTRVENSNSLADLAAEFEYYAQNQIDDNSEICKYSITTFFNLLLNYNPIGEGDNVIFDCTTEKYCSNNSRSKVGRNSSTGNFEEVIKFSLLINSSTGLPLNFTIENGNANEHPIVQRVLLLLKNKVKNSLSLLDRGLVSIALLGMSKALSFDIVGKMKKSAAITKKLEKSDLFDLVNGSLPSMEIIHDPVSGKRLVAKEFVFTLAELKLDTLELQQYQSNIPEINLDNIKNEKIKAIVYLHRGVSEETYDATVDLKIYVEEINELDKQHKEYKILKKYQKYIYRDENGELRCDHKKFQSDYIISNLQIVVSTDASLSCQEIYQLYHERYLVESSFKFGKQGTNLHTMRAQDDNALDMRGVLYCSSLCYFVPSNIKLNELKQNKKLKYITSHKEMRENLDSIRINVIRDSSKQYNAHISRALAPIEKEALSILGMDFKTLNDDIKNILNVSRNTKYKHRITEVKLNQE